MSSNTTLAKIQTATPSVTDQSKPKTVRELLADTSFMDALSRAMPSGVMRIDRFVRVALTAVNKNPDLAKCTVSSFAQCMLDCAQLGLEAGGPLKRAWLIPYKNTKKNLVECTLQIGYPGLIALALRSEKVRSIKAEVIFEKDYREIEYGVHEKLVHRPFLEGDAGDWQYVYAVARLDKGDPVWILMTKGEVLAIRDRQPKRKQSPWDTDFFEMVKKTAIRRISKILPLAAEVYEADDKEHESLKNAGAITVPFDIVGATDAPIDDEPPAPSEARDKAIANIEEMVSVIGLKYGTAPWTAVVAGAAQRADIAIDAGRGGASDLYGLPDAVLHEIIRELETQMPQGKSKK